VEPRLIKKEPFDGRSVEGRGVAGQEVTSVSCSFFLVLRSANRALLRRPSFWCCRRKSSSRCVVGQARKRSGKSGGVGEGLVLGSSLGQLECRSGIFLLNSVCGLVAYLTEGAEQRRRKGMTGKQIKIKFHKKTKTATQLAAGCDSACGRLAPTWVQSAYIPDEPFFGGGARKRECRMCSGGHSEGRNSPALSLPTTDAELPGAFEIQVDVLPQARGPWNFQTIGAMTLLGVPLIGLGGADYPTSPPGLSRGPGGNDEIVCSQVVVDGGPT